MSSVGDLLHGNILEIIHSFAQSLVEIHKYMRTANARQYFLCLCFLDVERIETNSYFHTHSLHWSDPTPSRVTDFVPQFL